MKQPHIFFMVLLVPYASLIAQEGESYTVDNSIFYEIHEEGDGAGDEAHLEEEEFEQLEEHHHHHAPHGQAPLSTNSLIPSTVSITGGAPVVMAQESGLTSKTGIVTVKPKMSDNQYRSKLTRTDDTLFAVDLSPAVVANPVDQYFTTLIWDDPTFQRSLLTEYKKFFDIEMQNAKSDITKKKSAIEEREIINTILFKKALAKFKLSDEGINLQQQLASYITSINNFLAYMKDKEKTGSSQAGLIVQKCEKVGMVGNELTSYVLTYKANVQEPVCVTEKSMSILFGFSFFNAFVAKQKLYDVVINIPYESVLDVFNDQNKRFSLSLLRSKIYYTDSNK